MDASSKERPQKCRKLVATERGYKFNEVVSTVETPMPSPGVEDVLVKNRYVGINASDIAFTAGRYDPDTKYPLDCGFEGMGEVVGLGQGVKSYSVGQSVMYLSAGAFSEYKTVNFRSLMPIPAIKPEFLPFMISGSTAAIALDKVGEIKKGETVLITAAAGGTGQIAVQWAKQAGCHVIGTCSTDEKAGFLKSIGCDRPVNYKKEILREVLETEYKNGVDVVFETIGGEMFDTCLDALAVFGRLIIVGYIESYQSDSGFNPPQNISTLPKRLVHKSACVKSFHLKHFFNEFPKYVQKMVRMLDQGQIQSFVDMGDNSKEGRFVGIDSIYRGVEHLYTKKNIGKVVVDLHRPGESKL